MEYLVLLAVLCMFSLSNMACFLAGAYVMQCRQEKKEIPVPVNHFASYRKSREEKEAKRAEQVLQVTLENIENYNGTAEGQKDIPWR